MTDEPDQALDLLTDAHEPARRRRKGQCQRRPSSRRCRGRSIAGLDRLYGVVPVASTDLYTFKPAEGADAVRPRARWSRAPTATRTSSTAPTKAVYRIGLKNKEATLVVKQGTKNKSGTVADPRYLGRRRPGPADPRYQERPVALAAVQRCRQGHADQGHAPGLGLARRRHHGHQHLPAARDARPLQPVHRRSVRAADPGLLAGRRRQRLPGQGDALAGDRARRLGDDLDVRRRRPVRGRRRRAGPLRRRQERGLDGQGAEGQPAPFRAGLLDHRGRPGPAGGPDLRASTSRTGGSSR